MPTINIDNATEKLIAAVENMPAYDVVQVYNELFPEDPAAEDEDTEDARPLVERIVAHIRRGLEAEEAVDLWNVVFPGGSEVYFDEEDNLLHFQEPSVAE